MPKIIYRDREWEVATNITVRDAIKKGDLNPETVLATRDGKLVVIGEQTGRVHFLRLERV